MVSKTHMNLLIHLDNARLNGSDWSTLPKEIPYYSRMMLTRSGLIEARGKTNDRQYRITDAGQQALVTGELPNGHSDEPLDDLVIVPNGHHTAADNIERLSDIAATGRQNGHHAEPVSVAPIINEEPDPRPCDGCAPQSCVYRQAFELVADRVPEVRGLVEALRELDSLK